MARQKVHDPQTAAARILRCSALCYSIHQPHKGHALLLLLLLLLLLHASFEGSNAHPCRTRLPLLPSEYIACSVACQPGRGCSYLHSTTLPSPDSRYHFLQPVACSDSAFDLQVPVVEGLIRQIGLAPTKARNIVSMSQVGILSLQLDQSQIFDLGCTPLQVLLYPDKCTAAQAPRCMPRTVRCKCPGLLGSML